MCWTRKITPQSELHSYNEVLPLMMVRYLGPGLLGLGITALIAGFMSGMAGNMSAFSTVWTYDLYKPLINKKATDSHYVVVGRMSIVIGVIVSIGAGYLVQQRARHHGLRAGALQHLHCAAAGHYSCWACSGSAPRRPPVFSACCWASFFRRACSSGSTSIPPSCLRGAFARRQADG